MKKAMDYLTRHLRRRRGRHPHRAAANTLDAAWYGKIPWLSLHYTAALLAAAAMADEMGDTAYAKHCRTLADRGRHYLETKLFNGEYFFQRAGPRAPQVAGHV